MEHNKEKDSQFNVVHFLQEPFEGIDYYVCVPYTWVIIHRFKEKIVVVTYPKNEEPFAIRERAKKKEKHNIDWAFCTAELKYQCDTYEDAELWISTNNNHQLSIRKNSSTNGSTVPWDQELRSSNQKYSSKSEDKFERRKSKPYQIPKKGSPKSMDKESYDEAKKRLYLKRLNWKNKTAKSTAQKADLRPVSSTESTTIRDEPSMESPQAKEIAETDGAKSTEGSSHSTEQVNDEQEQSMLVIDVDGISDVVNSEDQSQQEQPGETNGNQNQLSNNFVVAPKSPSPIKQTPQPNQHHDQRIRIKDIWTLTAPSNNQEPRVDTSNTRQITSQLALNTDLFNQIENARRNMMIAAQTSSNRIDLTQPLPKPLTQPSPANIQNLVYQKPPIFIANSMNCAPVAGITTSSQGIQHVTGMNTVSATDPRVVYSVASVAAPQNLPQLNQSPIFVYQGVQQNLPAPPEHMLMPGQGLLQIPTTQSLDPRLRGQYHPISQVPQYQPVRPSFNNNPTNVPSQFHQPQEIQHQGQRTVNHQDAQRPQAPVYIPIFPKNDRQNPTLQGVKKTTPPPTSSRIRNSVHQAILNALKKYPLNEQELQAILSNIPKEQINPGLMNVLRNIAVLQAHCSHRSKMSAGSCDQSSMKPSPVHQHVSQNPRPQVDQSNEANPTMKRVKFQDDPVTSATKQRMVADSGHKTNVCMPELLSSPNSAASDSRIETDHEAAFDYEMSVDEAHEAANETDQTRRSSRDRSTAQNSLSELALQQQMEKQFATFCSQVSSTLYNTAKVFDNLPNSLLETAKSYQTFFDNKRINASENSANHVSSSSSVAEEVPPVVEERQNSAPERRNSNNGNQSNGVSEAPKRIYQKTSKHLLSTRQFVLPPEYDPDDTKWTLKYRNHLPGHLELIPHSNIYVRYNELTRCEEVSNSCESLARMMLHEVFNEKALGVCASMIEAVKINYNTDPDARPPLDNHGSLVLLNYVIQYGVKLGWSIDVAKILNTLDQEVKKIRFEYAVESRFC